MNDRKKKRREKMKTKDEGRKMKDEKLAKTARESFQIANT